MHRLVATLEAHYVRPHEPMQTLQQISIAQLDKIVDAVFAQGPMVVRQAYSDVGCPTRDFADTNALRDDLHYEPGARDVFRQNTIYYPDGKGHTHERRIELNPRKYDGHTFRFCQEGWGLIQLQCDFRAHQLWTAVLRSIQKAAQQLGAIHIPILKAQIRGTGQLLRKRLASWSGCFGGPERTAEKTVEREWRIAPVLQSSVLGRRRVKRNVP